MPSLSDFAPRPAILAAACLPLLTLLAGPSQAHGEHVSVLQEIFVFGRAASQIGSADSASEGLVGYGDLRLPPLLRVGELAEAVPGMVATQHSGTGKANQYYLRGFNLDHGTDFSASLSGVPLNMRSHGHGQGYLDLNFLIPELVATTRYRKGPYHTGNGDFSSAGSVSFDYYDRFEESLLDLSVGEHGYQRGLLAGSVEAGDSVFTGAVDLNRYDGPWEMEEDLRQDKIYLAWQRMLGPVRAELDVQGYFSDWNATDQIPARAVDDGRVSRLGFLDPDLGGSTDRVAVNGALDFGAVRGNVYLIDYDFSLFSNFTYQLEDPDFGDEFEQRDQRQVFGYRVEGEWQPPGSEGMLRWGNELRVDSVDEVGLYRTAARQRLGVSRSDQLNERSLGSFLAWQQAFGPRLRATLGLRSDYYGWDVTALNPINSGEGEAHQFSPKLSLAYRLSETLEAYYNVGRGMHSNDVRGVTIQRDPLTAEPAMPVPALVPTLGSEVGLRFEPSERFNATVVAYTLDVDSELVFVGDAGGTETNSGSRRRGIETALFWHVSDWLALDADYSRNRGRLQDAAPGEDRIPGAIESSLSFGANALLPYGLSSSLQLRYLGESALLEDNSVRAPASTLLNGSIAWQRNNTEWRLEVFNLLDSDDYDVAYWYASRLPGEPLAGIEDLHYHPLEPRVIRVGMRVSF